MDFHFFHALALLGLAGWMRPPPTGAAARRATQAVRAWLAGTVLFSGSLYALRRAGRRCSAGSLRWAAWS